MGQKLSREQADIEDVGLRPIQRFLQGNGWKRLKKGHPRHGGVEECWEKKLQDGRTAWMFQFPESSSWRSPNPHGFAEPTWRFEVYRANPREYDETTLSETPMLYLLRAILQRLSTWNRRQAGDPPGGSGPHTFF